MNDSLKNHSGPGRDFPPAIATRRPLSADKKKNVSRLTRRYFTLNAATVGLNIIQGRRRLELVILERAVKVRWPFYARKDSCTTGLRMLNQTGSAFFPPVSSGCSNAERHAGCVVAGAPKGWMEGWTYVGRRKRGEKGLFCGRLHTQQLHLWRVKGREVRVHATHCCQCKMGHRDWNQSIHPSTHPSMHASILPRTPPAVFSRAQTVAHRKRLSGANPLYAKL